MRAQKIKMKKLKDFEQKIKKKRAAEKGTKKNNAFLNLFMNAQGTKKIMEAVINNLQVKVENVHIRYQDLTDQQVLLSSFFSTFTYYVNRIQLCLVSL